MPANPPQLVAARFLGAARVACAGIALAALSACSSVSLDEPLEGTPWRLVQLDGQQVMVGADPKIDPTLQFDAGAQRVSGNGGCNNLSGGYKRSGTALRIGPLASTRRACIDNSRSRLETRFLAALEATAGYSVKGGQLTLLDGRSMPLPVAELADYTALATVVDGSLLVTISGPPLSAGPMRGKAPPLVTMGVAGRSRHGAALWPLLTGPRMPPARPGITQPAAPWCAVAVWPTLMLHPGTMDWLYTLERCIAWAWIERADG